MKLSATTLTLLLPTLALTSPVAVTPNDDALLPRADTSCTIINVSTVVACRTGPGTNYPVYAYLPPGDVWPFRCYKRGECINGNWCVFGPYPRSWKFQRGREKRADVVVLARGIMRRRLNAMLAGITPRARALSVGFLCLLSGDRG